VNSQDERDRYVLGILKDRASRGGSRWVHEQLRVGQVLKIGTRATTSPCTRTPRIRCWWPAASA
jgi:ferredoxin-NADP reductase